MVMDLEGRRQYIRISSREDIRSAHDLPHNKSSYFQETRRYEHRLHEVRSGISLRGRVSLESRSRESLSIVWSGHGMEAVKW